MAVSSIHLVFLFLLLGKTHTAKLPNREKQTDELVYEEVKKEQANNGINISSILPGMDIDLDKMAAEAEEFVRRFGVDENTLSDVKKYLHQNEIIASTAESARDSLSKGKDMLRQVSSITTPFLIHRFSSWCRASIGWERCNENWGPRSKTIIIVIIVNFLQIILMYELRWVMTKAFNKFFYCKLKTNGKLFCRWKTRALVLSSFQLNEKIVSGGRGVAAQHGKAGRDPHQGGICQINHKSW